MARVKLLRRSGIPDDLVITSGLEAGDANRSSNLQTLINNASPGDTIVLDASATYTGNYTLPAKTPVYDDARDIITLTTHQLSTLPGATTRVTMSDAASMPTIQNANGSPVFSTANGAKWWTLRGLNITSNETDFTNANGIVKLTRASGGVENRPSYITIDRCWIHDVIRDAPAHEPVFEEGSAAVCVQVSGLLHGTIKYSRIAGAAYYDSVDGTGTGQGVGYALFSAGECEDLTVTDCFLEGYFAAVFTGGSTNDTPYTTTISGTTLDVAWTDFTMASPDHATLTGYQVRFVPTGAGTTVAPTTVIPIAVTSYSSPNVTIAEGMWPLKDGTSTIALGTEYDIECRTVAAGPTYGDWTAVKSAWTYQAHVATSTFADTTGLTVGKLIAVQTTGGRASPTNYNHGYAAYDYQVAVVTNVSGASISYTGYGALEGAMTGGNPLLQAPNGANNYVKWGPGYQNTNWTMTHVTFDCQFSSHEDGWLNHGGSVGKGHIETKNMDGLTLTGCVFQGWPMTYFISTRNQASSGTGLTGSNIWCVSKNITVQHCWFKYDPDYWDRDYMYCLAGPQTEDDEMSSERGSEVLIDNCLFENGGTGASTYAISAMQGCDNFTVQHCTWPGPRADTGGSGVAIVLSKNDGWIFRDNIFAWGTYGINNQSGRALNDVLPNRTVSTNVFIDTRSPGDKAATPNYITDNWPGNYKTATFEGVGWVNSATGNWRLDSGSSYKGVASDETDPGCDLDALKTALGALGAEIP